MRTAHLTHIKKKKIEFSKVVRINELFFENGYTENQIARELKLSMAVIWRNLAITRSDWEKMKGRLIEN